MTQSDKAAIPVCLILEIVIILPAGWYFGNFPIMKENFEFVVLGIIAVSVLHMVVEIARAKFGNQSRPAISPD
ncbi:MAG: hypothetical protein Q8Q59_06460 [Luteolibacter sp.]|jgi:membrane-associated protein|nr:hypothetical protein [Luteolibacter sp.]